MDNRRIISYVFFAAAIVLLVLGVLGVAGLDLTRGILLGLGAALVGVIFYRRGK